MYQKTVIFLGLLIFTLAAYAEDTQTQRRIALLESALSPTSPKATAEMWAKAVKSRNGAVQYMLMCQNQQKINLNQLIKLNWVTGTSSPWISSYKIISQGKRANLWQFEIQYGLATGGGSMGINTDHITIVAVNSKFTSSQKWCVNQFRYLSGVS